MFNSIVLYLIYKCIDLFCLIQRLYRNLYALVVHYWSLLSSFLQIHRSKNIFSLKKTPTHLGIIIAEDKVSFPDIANLIVWSFCLGIHHISIYDSTGYIKLNGNHLYKETSKKQELYLKKKACYFNVIFSDGSVPFSYNICYKNGHITEDVNVYLLSQEDGKQQIIEAAKTVCVDAKREPKILESFHAKNFNQYIKAIINIPEPEAILLFGCSNGLIGYLPWHIRLSELIFQITHHGIRLKEFENALLRYSKCEQRFGK